MRIAAAAGRHPREAVLGLCRRRLRGFVCWLRGIRRYLRGIATTSFVGSVATVPYAIFHFDRATQINADQCKLLQPLAEKASHIAIDALGPRGTCEAIAQRLESLGIELFFIELTRARVGVPVVRVIAPALQIEPSEIVTPRLAEMIARTGGGMVYTGGIALL